LKSITLDQVKSIFRSENQNLVPLLHERTTVLQELGSIVCKEFGGKFSNILVQSSNSAQRLISIMTTHFSSYRDECNFSANEETRRAYFHKRVQILVADLWACFEGSGFGQFNDIDYITMFADYRVPQALAYLGAIKYSESLTKFLESNVELTPGDRRELEIRAASIWSVELIKREMLKLAENLNESNKDPINSIVIDFYLWTYAKQFGKEMKNIPIHKIRTIYY